MLKILAELGVGLIGQVAQGHLAKKAIKTLVKGGLLSEKVGARALKYPKFGKRILGSLSGQSSNLQKGLFRGGTLAASAKGSAFPQAFRYQARNVLKVAQHQMANSRGYGAISKIMFGAGMAWGGFELASGGEKMFEKNIPGGFSEIMQTQQQFLPRQAHTQRQRAIQAIHQSQLSTRSALGNESQFIH